MKKNIIILAAIFSVVLNISLIGLALHRPSAPARPRPIYETLGLTTAQMEKFKPERDRFHAFIDVQGRRIKDKEIELISLLAVPEPDRRAIDAKQEEIRHLQQQMQTRVIDHFLAESAVFTPEQRARFFTIIRKRIENSSLRPRWMPGRGHGQEARP